MVETLIEKVFHARDAAHIEHWKTDSYSKHKSLGHYYEDVVEQLDKFIEAYQGTFGIIGDVAGQEKDVSKMVQKSQDIHKMLILVLERIIGLKMQYHHQ